MTKLYNFKKDIDKNKLEEISKCIKNEGIIVFPTETVYGIGANTFSYNAVNKIFKAKGRPNDNPLIVHISDFEMVNLVGEITNKIEEILIQAFWPGPMTIILNKNKNIPDNVTGKLNTVGIRMPSNNIAREIIRKAGVPIAAPSANISGRPSGTKIEDIYDELKDKVDYIIDAGESEIGIESTVLKVVNNEVIILRPGKISLEDIEKLGLKARLDNHIYLKAKDNEKVESPGIKYRHYAPKTETFLICNEKQNIMINKIEDMINENRFKNKKICVIGFEENKNVFSKYDNVKYISYGNNNDLNLVSKSIFSALRKVDEIDVDICFIEGVKKTGVGIAIMNRLIKACGYNVIEC